MQQTINWQLLAKHFAHETSPDEDQKIENWLAEDASHTLIFKQAEQAWQQPYPGNSAFNPNKGISLLDAKLKRQSTNHSSSRRMYKMPALLQWAAVCVLTFGLGALAYFSARSISSPPVIEYVEQINRTRQRSVVSLADGSTVYLNAQSALKYPKQFSATTREVFISGEAFFDVSRNPGKPFLVHSGAHLCRR